MTYSIIGRDDRAIGCAVQSQAFNCGAAVPWVRAGVGAVATQSFTDRRYGYRGLELLAAGRSPQDALDALLSGDAMPQFRQVAFMSLDGRAAQWTGESCVNACGHVAGDGWAAQGNMLVADAWRAMGAAFEQAEGSLAGRLMAALEAAEETGGDFRGRGGCAIVVAPLEGEPWERIVDLRVEEGDTSLVELRRLLERAEAYRSAGAAPARENGMPDHEIQWRTMLDAAEAGDFSKARAALAELEKLHPYWRDLARSASTRPDAPAHLRDIVE
ncbi:MAG TPA: DUF1028 domain-containing protein [Gaiellaceae bacterium]